MALLLTKGFHKANTLTPDELDEGVQRVLDRLVFIRVTEDRGIEPNILLSMLRQSKVAAGFSLRKNLTKIFRDFDEGYNSKLFTHHSSENWQIDNETLERVINGLYETGDGYRYDFSAISADVLGGIYEQYLGHILKQATKRASVKKEHKKRKEQGIYYTPQFVVDYIVKNTIGRLLSDKSYREAIDLKVLDPACGSGSFLIRAYDELVNYFEKKDKQANLFTKFRILTANIYGVDLDAQAVEIAQLNLLLKTLSTKARLPNLAGKIRIGNSLISENDPIHCEEQIISSVIARDRVPKQSPLLEIATPEPALSDETRLLHFARNGNMKKQRPSKEVIKALKGDNLL